MSDSRTMSIVLLLHLFSVIQVFCVAVPLMIDKRRLNKNEIHKLVSEMNVNKNNKVTQTADEKSVVVTGTTTTTSVECGTWHKENRDQVNYDYEAKYIYDCTMPTIPPLTETQNNDWNMRKARNVQQPTYRIVDSVVGNVNGVFLDMAMLGQNLLNLFVPLRLRS